MGTITDQDDDQGRVLTGTAGESNTIHGLGGDDHLVGQEFLDLLYGGDGEDSFESGSGTDFIYGGAGADTLEMRGYGSFDTDYFEDFKASEGDRIDVRYLNIGSLDTIKILSGTDPNHDNDLFITWGAASSPSYVVLDGVKESDIQTSLFIFDKNKTNDKLGLDNAANFQAFGFGNDVIKGNGGDDVLFGEQGNDTLHGGSGKNELYGGEGSDTLVSSAIGDYLDGGAATDRLQLDYVLGASSVNKNATIDIGNGQIKTALGQSIFTSFETILVNKFSGFGGNTLNVIGSTGMDEIEVRADCFTNFHGSAGADKIIASGDKAAAMIYDRRVDVNTISGNKGSGDAKGDALFGIDDIFMSSGNDSFIGTDMKRVVGNAGNDVISLTDGESILQGGLGQDIMNGGIDKKKDGYVYNSVKESTVSDADVIFFEDGYDVIVFQNIFGKKPIIHEGALSGNKPQLTWEYDVRGGNDVTTLRADVDGNGKVDMMINIQDHISVSASDFIFT